MREKKTLVFSIITLVAMMIFAGGVTFAYFTNGGRTTIEDVDVKTYTTSAVFFSISNDLKLEVYQDEFAIDVGNKFATSVGTVNFKSGTDTNMTSLDYNVGLKIDTNDFEYTTSTNKPEIIFQVESPEGEITSINNLQYKTVTNGKGETISGFDITNATGEFEIYNNYTIVGNPNQDVIHTWNFKVVFVNLDTDQGEGYNNISNLEKRFKGQVSLTRA